MTDRADSMIIDQINSLNLPIGDYAVFGSGLLEVLGIRRSSDIDLILTKKLFNQLADTEDWDKFSYKGGEEGIKHQNFNIEAFYYSDTVPGCDELSIKTMIEKAVNIKSVRFVPLEDTLRWKTAFGRSKDLEDVKLIKEFMKKEGL